MNILNKRALSCFGLTKQGKKLTKSSKIISNFILAVSIYQLGRMPISAHIKVTAIVVYNSLQNIEVYIRREMKHPKGMNNTSTYVT